VVFHDPVNPCVTSTICRCAVLLEHKHTIDHWQQSFQQQFITVVGAVNLHNRIQQPNFKTATDTISDLLKVGRVHKSQLAAMSRFLQVDW